MVSFSVEFVWQEPVGSSMLHGALDSVFMLFVFYHTLDSGSFICQLPILYPYLAIELLSRLHSVLLVLFSTRNL